MKDYDNDIRKDSQIQESLKKIKIEFLNDRLERKKMIDKEDNEKHSLRIIECMGKDSQFHPEKDTIIWPPEQTPQDRTEGPCIVSAKSKK